MKRIIITGFILCTAFFLSQDLFAQGKAKSGPKYWYKRHVPKRAKHGHKWVWTKRREYVSFGLNLNAINYFGDIVPRPTFTSTDIRMTRPQISAFVQKRFRPQVTGRLSLGWGRVLGTDSVTADRENDHDVFRYIRNASFRNDIFELVGTMKFDLMQEPRLNREFYNRPKSIVPYLTMGVGVFYHNPQAKAPEEFGGDWESLQPLGTEGQGRTKMITEIDPETGEEEEREVSIGDRYSKWQITFPVGIGFRKQVSPRLDIAFEVSYRFMLTDYLDDVSNMYQDLGVFGDDELAKAFHDRSREGDREVYLQQLFQQGDIAHVPTDYTYTGVDGRTYTTYTGFGEDRFPDNIRGNRRDRDVYLLTGFHFIYVLAPEQTRCPIRF